MRRQSRPFLFGNVERQVAGPRSSPSLVFTADGTSLATVTYLQSLGERVASTRSLANEKNFTVRIRRSRMTASEGHSICSSRNENLAGRQQNSDIGKVESPFQMLREIAFDGVQFTVPRKTLEVFAEYARLPAVSECHIPEKHQDLVLLRLAEMAIPWVDNKLAFPYLFLDLYIQMLCSQLVRSCGIASSAPNSYQCGLAPWQKKRIQELLEGNLEGDLRLTRLASECGLSASYFSRCFRATFGSSAHQFVINRRIKRAQQLLLESELPLATIALETGFSDQAAFSRAFGAIAGTPPARWRTEHLARTRMNAIVNGSKEMVRDSDLSRVRSLNSSLEMAHQSRVVAPRAGASLFNLPNCFEPSGYSAA